MGIFDIFDSELIEKVKAIADAIDQDKIRQVMDAIEVKDGKVAIDVRLIFSKPETHELLATEAGTETTGN